MQDLDQVLGRSHYYVVYDGGWLIQCDGENSEPYHDKQDAFRLSLIHISEPTRPY